jgi:hypothetical protein
LKLSCAIPVIWYYIEHVEDNNYRVKKKKTNKNKKN